MRTKDCEITYNVLTWTRRRVLENSDPSCQDYHDLGTVNFFREVRYKTVEIFGRHDGERPTKTTTVTEMPGVHVSW